MKDLLKKVPIPTAGVALGLAALGNLLQEYSEMAHIICGVCAFVMVALLLGKVVTFPRMIRNDFEDSILASVSATCFMTLMQLALYVEPFAHEFAFALWCVAIAAHFALMLWFTKKFILHFRLVHVFPTYFIAYVGIIVASLTSPAFGAQTFGMVVFWFGFACYAVLLVVVTLRYVKHEVPEAARPLICIYAAPMSLSLAGYLAVSPQPNEVFVLVLAVLAQVLFALVAFVLPRILRLNFYPSYAAMTFPFVITAIGLKNTMVFFSGLGTQIPWWIQGLEAVEAVFAACMVIYVFAHYLHYFFKKVEEPVPVPAVENQRIW